MAISKTDINPATGKAYAVNPSSGVWDDNYWANVVEPQLKSSGGMSGGSTSGGANSIASTAQQLLQMQQQANQPAIQSLQASLPEIQNKFAQTGQYLQGQVGNLQSRYDALLKSITGQQGQETQRTATATSSELGRRGISSQSGLYDQTINKALNPINETYAGALSQTGLQKESDIANLLNMISGNTASSVEAQRAVQNAIASLQGGGNGNFIGNAIDLYKAQNPAAQQQNAVTVGSGSTLVDPVTGKVIYNNLGSSGGGSNYYSTPTSSSGFVPLTPQQQLQQQVGGNVPSNSYQQYLGLNKILGL